MILLLVMEGGAHLSKKQINIIDEILASVGLESLKPAGPKNVFTKIS